MGQAMINACMPSAGIRISDILDFIIHKSLIDVLKSILLLIMAYPA
jgi:hypothetical protein